MKTVTYKLGDLRSIVKESSQEFKAKLGTNVEKDDKENNQKSYKESEKRAKDFNGGLTTAATKRKLQPKIDGNKTTLDSSFDDEPSKEYKDRIKAQANGYTSKMEEDNKIEKNADFDENPEIYKNFKDAKEKMAGQTELSKKSGLVSRELPDDTFKKGDMYEGKKTKRLSFKHSEFLSEEHMLSRIPDEYKVDGQRIIMKDAHDNEYVVECKFSKMLNICETKVVSYTNKKKINEDVEKIKKLFNYNSSDFFGSQTSNERLNEDKKFGQIIDDIRKIK